jgi:hypothetical protein
MTDSNRFSKQEQIAREQDEKYFTLQTKCTQAVNDFIGQMIEWGVLTQTYETVEGEEGNTNTR